jgi:hypothetical protein
MNGLLRSVSASPCLGLGVSALLTIGAGANAQFPMIQEAENCSIKCQTGHTFIDNIWARGRKPTPNFWGRGQGDSVTWTFELRSPKQGLNLGVRYAYGEAEYRAHYPTNPKQTLQVILDRHPPLELSVPDTGSFDIYDTVSLALPNLTAGKHMLQIVASAADTTRNLDTLILFEGQLELLPVTLRKTIVAEAPSKHFFLRVTPGVKFVLSPEEIFREFESIHAYYKDFMGWEFPTAIPVILIEEDKWPSNSTAFQNNGGVFFRAGVMATEQGNWVHEMTHMWYMAHFPNWFDEASVRTLTAFVWCPNLFPPRGKLEADPVYARSQVAGKEVLASPAKRYNDLEPILDALVVKYGPKVFRRFFHLCADAGKQGDLDFAPGHWMKKDQIVKYMSQAAGEDVGPLFRRWNGLGAAQ